MNVFPFVEAEKAEQRNVAKACELLEVSRSAFYEWSKHVPSPRQLADDELGERIVAVHKGSRGTYGWPRVHRQRAGRASAPRASGWPASCASEASSVAVGAGGPPPPSPTPRRRPWTW